MVETSEDSSRPIDAKLPRLDSNQDKENQNLLCSGHNCEPASASGDGVFSPAHPPTLPADSDPDLARVVAAWPDLSDAIRAAVVTLIDAALTAQQPPR